MCKIVDRKYESDCLVYMAEVYWVCPIPSCDTMVFRTLLWCSEHSTNEYYFVAFKGTIYKFRGSSCQNYFYSLLTKNLF